MNKSIYYVNSFEKKDDLDFSQKRRKICQNDELNSKWVERLSNQIDLRKLGPKY